MDGPVEKIVTAERSVKKFWIVPWLIFGILAACWVAFFALTSPNSGGTDAFIFRDAGCNCAAGLGLVSNSVPTDAASIPSKLFAAYTPGAPLLFAPAARIFGCSAYLDTYYNFFLLLLVSFFTLCLYFRFEEGIRRRVVAALVVGITAPGGLFLSDLDRPEAIALAVAFPLLLAWKSSTGVAAKIFVLGCTGLLFLIHPYAGLVELFILLFLLACETGQRSRPTICLAGLALASGIVALCSIYLQHLDPTTIHRFLGHAFGARSGAGAILNEQAAHAGLLHDYVGAASKYFGKAHILTGTPLLALLCGFAMMLTFVLLSRQRSGRRNALLQLFCLFCILFLFPAAIFLPQRNYFAASNAFLFVAVTIGGYNLSDRLRQSWAPLLLLLIVAFFSLPQFALNVIASTELRASYRHASEQAARVKMLFAKQGDSEPRLLVDSEHFFLYKPYFRYLYNRGYLQPDDDTSEFQGLALCYTGQLAFSRSQLEWRPPLRQSDWELIDGGENVERITLFGHPIQRRNWTWSCDVYERRNAAP